LVNDPFADCVRLLWSGSLDRPPLPPDGSLTLYAQSDSPGKEANWLPAPAGADFSLYIRTYWPKKEVLDGSWAPPGIKKTGG
jgi:hypothetical protein